jgi:hypothetical protein
MGKINLPQPQETSFKPQVKETIEIADTLPSVTDELKEKIKEQAGIEKQEPLADRATRLISYKKFLDVKIDNKEELSYLAKIDELLENEGLKTQKKKAEIIKTVQYKLGGKPTMERVYQYIKIESQIKSLVSKLKNV